MQVSLRVAVAVVDAIVVVSHFPVVDVVAIVLASTPPVAVVAGKAESVIRVASTARQSRKAEIVRAY